MGIILSYEVYSKTKGANGTVSLKLGNAASSTTVTDVVSGFGSNSNISGSVTIESVPFSIKQKESKEIHIYAVITTTNGIKITAKKSLFLKEGDPEFTLANREDQEFTLNTGDTKNIGVTVFPENASLGMGNGEIKGDNPDTATARFDYSSQEIAVTASSMEGTATFTVKAKITNVTCPR